MGGYLGTTLLLASWLVGEPQTGPPAPKPYRLDIAAARGCGDLFVFGWTEPRTEALVIQIDRAKVALRTGTNSLDLDTAGPALQIRLDRYTSAPSHWPYCTDVFDGSAEKPRAWHARSARVTITLTERGAVPNAQPHNYRVTIRLENVVLETADGSRITLDRPMVVSAVVGDYSG